ncbi:MAG: hypothetical protein KDM64_08270 [Verrucomicrobiae bacterium]|nr:hypothetical protein [Verrucomicrobiae bacterium]
MSSPYFDFPEGHTPRRGRLMTSGIILALAGCAFGLLSAVYLILFRVMIKAMAVFPPTITASVAPSGSTPPATPPPAAPNPLENLDFFTGMMTLAGVLFGVVALVFLVVGAGSMFLKRWSRPFALVIGTVWLYVGVLYLLMVILSAGGTRRAMAESIADVGAAATGADAMFGVMIAVSIIMTFVFGIMLPSLILWLNWHRDVAVTLEFCDRKPRWTDLVPVPVLGISVIATAFALNFIVFQAFPWFPLFGQLFTGNAARGIGVALSLVLLGLAWGAYRRSVIAWGLLLLLTLAMAATTIITGLSLDYRSFYEAMGFPEEMIESSVKSAEIYQSPVMIWSGTLAGFLPIVGFLIWARKYFFNRPLQAA